MIRRRSSGQKGAALIYVLFALLVLSAMSTMLYELLNELRTGLGGWTWKAKAEAAAESSVAVAELKLLDDPAWRAGEDTTPEFETRVGDAGARLKTAHLRPPDMVEVTAVGRHRQGRSRIVRRIRLSDPTLYALLAGKRAVFEFGTTLDGAVAAGEEIRIGRGVGVPQSAPPVSLVSGRQISPTGVAPYFRPYESADPMPDIPVLNLAEIKNKIETRIANSELADVKLAGRQILRDGSLTILDGAFDDVSIYVAGDLRIIGAPKMDSKGDTPVFIVEKNLIANFSGADIRGVIYVGGKATLRGQAVITGTIIADEIDIAGGVTVRAFDRDPSRKRPEAGFFKRDVEIGVP